MGAPWYLRDSAVLALARGDTYVFLRPAEAPLVVEAVDVEAVARILGRTITPVAGSDLASWCDEATLALLVGHGILLRGSQAELAARVPPAPSAPAKLCRRVVVGVAGAFGAARALDHVLAVANTVADEVDVVVTRAARRVVQPRAYEQLGLRTWIDPFEPRHGVTVPHMHLATTAELVLIAPASANAIRRLATGACSDLLSLVVAATSAPVVVAPAMNERLWANPAVARNVTQLRADGIWVVEPNALGAIGFDPPHVGRLVAGVLEQRRG